MKDLEMREGSVDSRPDLNGAAGADAPYVAEYPGVCGGYPVLERMRFPIRIVVEAYRELGDIERVAELYPQLTTAQIRCALDYYTTNPARVDEDIERNASAYRKYVGARSLPWPD